MQRVFISPFFFKAALRFLLFYREENSSKKKLLTTVTISIPERKLLQNLLSGIKKCLFTLKLRKLGTIKTENEKIIRKFW